MDRSIALVGAGGGLAAYLALAFSLCFFLSGLAVLGTLKVLLMRLEGDVSSSLPERDWRDGLWSGSEGVLARERDLGNILFLPFLHGFASDL